jgi:hypothetical protein
MKPKPKSARQQAREAAKAPAGALHADPSLDALLERVDLPAASPAAPGPVVARISGLAKDGGVLVDLPGVPGPVPARSTVPVTPAEVGREGLVFFAGGDRNAPILTGLLQTADARGSSLPDVLHLEAGRELTLRCGKATLRLTADGRIVIRGADVLTRSTGNNRIKGGAVQIN